MKKTLILMGLIFAIVAMAFRNASFYIPEIPAGWPKPVYDFQKKPLDSKKIALGRRLFYDPILSKDSTISCASCHSPFNAFTHVDHNLSHGIQDRIGTRNSPVLFNLAWSKHFMWDGSVSNLDEQARTPICNPLEMDETMPGILKKLNADGKYPELFADAFASTTISENAVLQSLSQFMLTIISCNSKYDSVINGLKTFTDQEKKGYVLFKKNCASCHTEPLFTNGKFENNGLMIDDELNDWGRMKISGKQSDSLHFKVPTLRNIEYSYPYMHDGRFKTLGQVLNNYIRGIQHGPTLSPALKKGIYLTPDEKVDMVAFLLTLSDKEFLRDKRFSFFQNN